MIFVLFHQSKRTSAYQLPQIIKWKLKRVNITWSSFIFNQPKNRPRKLIFLLKRHLQLFKQLWNSYCPAQVIKSHQLVAWKFFVWDLIKTIPLLFGINSGLLLKCNLKGYFLDLFPTHVFEVLGIVYHV